jgi:hypothetical protein
VYYLQIKNGEQNIKKYSEKYCLAAGNLGSSGIAMGKRFCRWGQREGKK